MSEATIQTAVFERLTTHTGLIAKLAGGAGGVYDHVPQAAKGEDDGPFPFLTIGDDDHDAWDTDDTDGYESELRVHVWSRHRGRLEAKEIQEQVYLALHHHQLAITGAATVLLHWVSSDVVRDPDGLTYHGVTRFRLLADREAA